MIGRERFRELRRSVLGLRGLRVGLRSVFLGRLSFLGFFFVAFSDSLFFLDFLGETTWVEGFSLGLVLEFSSLSNGGDIAEFLPFSEACSAAFVPDEMETWTVCRGVDLSFWVGGGISLRFPSL